LILREGPECVQEIYRCRDVLPPHVWRDLVFAIASPNWDTFASWEWNAKRHAGYLGDNNWDRLWVPEASSSDNDEDNDEDSEEEGTDVEDKQPPPPLAQVTSEVSGQIYNGNVVRDDTDDMIDHITYHILRAAERGEHFEHPPELTEEEELKVAIIVSAEEEKRAFPGYYDALALSMAPPPPPGLMPPCRCRYGRRPPRPSRDTRNEVWDALVEIGEFAPVCNCLLHRFWNRCNASGTKSLNV
jgi:hypothetical protein